MTIDKEIKSRYQDSREQFFDSSSGFNNNNQSILDGTSFQNPNNDTDQHSRAIQQQTRDIQQQVQQQTRDLRQQIQQQAQNIQMQAQQQARNAILPVLGYGMPQGFVINPLQVQPGYSSTQGHGYKGMDVFEQGSSQRQVVDHIPDMRSSSPFRANVSHPSQDHVIDSVRSQQQSQSESELDLPPTYEQSQSTSHELLNWWSGSYQTVRVAILAISYHNLQ